MAFKASSSGAFVRGVDASTSLYLQPRGSVPRASNLLLTKRGSLQTCNGSQIVNAFQGVPTASRGKAMCEFFFAPIGVAPYYLRIMKALDIPLGSPRNVTSALGSIAGIFAAGTYFWYITAVDGTGGETPAFGNTTISVGANGSVVLTWNVVPNAVGYNVYRQPSLGAIGLLNFSSGLGTAPQAALGSATATFTDIGYSTSPAQPPATDTTQQTALYQMPSVGNTLGYNNNSIVGLFPADARIIDGNPGGGTGGGGTTGGGTTGNPGSTPSGVYPPGNVSYIPQMVQYVNEAIIALGNSYPPQQFLDNTGTPDNPATEVGITSISVDAFGVVTVTTSAAHGLTATNVGACVVISLNAPYTAYDGCYQVITVPTTTTLTIRNIGAIGTGTGSGGTLLVTTIPLYNTFQPQFPPWAASTQYAQNSVVEPATPNGYYYKAIQAGTSAATAPAFPTTVGAVVQDGSVEWQNAGTTASAAPVPPGAAHIAVYSGALWVWDTFPTNTTNGLDGPCCLRMSDINEPNSWNPVNQAFLDKDDGTQGMGLSTFTITAQGIPPQGSLVACKLYATYQIVGVFGSSDFAIQRVTTDMGCLSPRTLQFVPGFGLGRMTHLGIAIFDGVTDRLVSPQVNPYLFPSPDPDFSDIVVADANWISLSMGVQTANPPMYVVFIPIGSSNGALTRGLCFDLVLKSWAIVDLPFPISATLQALTVSSNPVTLLGSFSDGTLQRWQAGDVTWATSNGDGGTAVPVLPSGFVRANTVASKDPDEQLYCRRFFVRGYVGSVPLTLFTINPRVRGVAIGAQSCYTPTAAGGEFIGEAAVGITSDRFDAFINFTGQVTIDDIGAHVTPKPIGRLTDVFV